MNIELDLLKKYNDFMKKNSIFSEQLQVLPDTPQSFSHFPTIIFREKDNKDNMSLKSTDYIEYGDTLTYQVDIYTKNVIIGTTEYNSRVIINELKDLTMKFFRYYGFRRESNVRGEYIDLSVKRQILLFSGSVSNWNGQIIKI